MTNKEAIEYLKEAQSHIDLEMGGYTQEMYDAIDMAIGKLQANDEQVVDKEMTERPTGEWIYTDIEDKRKGYGGYCSICKCDMPIFMEDWKHKYCETSYCPNCGAKMKGEEE